MFAANQAYNLEIVFTEQFRPEIERRLHKIALQLIGMTDNVSAMHCPFLSYKSCCYNFLLTSCASVFLFFDTFEVQRPEEGLLWMIKHY